MIDIYDGQVWKDCSNVNGRPFLSQPNSLALSLNVEWFRPFKHSQYSIGVIYIAVLNLPREIRYLPANIIITGIIAVPNEPSKTMMNPVLEPIVKDLQIAWDGFYITFPLYTYQYVSEQCSCASHAIFLPVERYVGFLNIMEI